jgi:hypothetical protein
MQRNLHKWLCNSRVLVDRAVGHIYRLQLYVKALKSVRRAWKHELAGGLRSWDTKAGSSKADISTRQFGPLSVTGQHVQ